MRIETAVGPCWIVENPHGSFAILRRCFKTHDEVVAYQTDKPSGMRSWNVPEGQTEKYIAVQPYL